ncbi:MAG: hypothetical protein DLM63_06290 [Solirubrobacterales bacterium]|nr:MAG: hypothetical protein DLM63_06290 [Solirubrobacterales bacterium]
MDHRLGQRARSQHGLLTHAQLLEAGLGTAAISYRIKVGRLHRVHRQVYAIGHRPVSAHARAMAAVLACGPGATLSHRSAAELWGHPGVGRSRSAHRATAVTPTCAFIAHAR